MQSQFFDYILLIIIILAFVMIAYKLRLAYPIILLIGGLVLSFNSRFSDITIDPELVFFIFLPPLLYEAAWQISWKEFWKWKRVIMSFAFPIVILTSCVIAFVSSAMIPGFTLALGFLLGGIISPPDAISATTIMRKLKVPKSLLSIIEGESLLNDASSLIIVRFALAAVITGQFHFPQASFSFFLVVFMGVAIGILVAYIFYAIHRFFPTPGSIEIVLTLITPYCMYYAAEQFHFSGVLAVVSGGLLLSSKRQSMLTYRSRIEGVNVWANLVFVLNALIFLLIGLQLPSIVNQLDISLWSAIGYGIAISLVLILTRMICTFGAAVFTRFMSRFIKVMDPNPGWKTPLVAGWAGMRGVVSLAAALSIPLLLPGGQEFPFRNLILFITFVVILFTLVIQGLTIPWLIRKVKLEDKFSSFTEEEQEWIIQKKIAEASLTYLEEKYGLEKSENKYLKNLMAKQSIDRNFFQQEYSEYNNPAKKILSRYQLVYLELLQHQRQLLIELNRSSDFDEDLIRKHLALIDLQELRLREKLLPENTSNDQ